MNLCDQYNYNKKHGKRFDLFLQWASFWELERKNCLYKKQNINESDVLAMNDYYIWLNIVRSEMRFLNDYQKWLLAVRDQLHLYFSEKQIYGHGLKERLKKKWHHRDVNKSIREARKVPAKLRDKYQEIYCGRKVFRYCSKEQGLNGWTSKPKQEGCRHAMSGSLTRVQVTK